MALSPQARAVVHKLGQLHTRAVNGDPASDQQIRSLKQRSQAGDPQARALFNTLSVIHWRRRDKARFAALEVMYQNLLQGDPQAQSQLQTIRQQQGQNPAALAMFRTLKSIHHKYKSSAWSGPGQPITGHYPMPRLHRPGIMIGASNSSYASLDSYGLARLLSLVADARGSVPMDFAATYSPTDDTAYNPVSDFPALSQAPFNSLAASSAPTFAPLPPRSVLHMVPAAAPPATLAQRQAAASAAAAAKPLSAMSSAELYDKWQGAISMKLPTATVNALKANYTLAVSQGR